MNSNQKPTAPQHTKPHPLTRQRGVHPETSFGALGTAQTRRGTLRRTRKKRAGPPGRLNVIRRSCERSTERARKTHRRKCVRYREDPKEMPSQRKGPLGLRRQKQPRGSRKARRAHSQGQEELKEGGTLLPLLQTFLEIRAHGRSCALICSASGSTGVAGVRRVGARPLPLAVATS